MNPIGIGFMPRPQYDSVIDRLNEVPKPTPTYPLNPSPDQSDLPDYIGIKRSFGQWP